jgi:two-component sensor histidine kinase
MVPPLSMVLQELGTNATKYGALSVPQSKITVSWSAPAPNDDASSTLLLEWKERGACLSDPSGENCLLPAELASVVFPSHASSSQ